MRGARSFYLGVGPSLTLTLTLSLNNPPRPPPSEPRPLTVTLTLTPTPTPTLTLTLTLTRYKALYREGAEAQQMYILLKGSLHHTALTTSVAESSELQALAAPRTTHHAQRTAHCSLPTTYYPLLTTRDLADRRGWRRGRRVWSCCRHRGPYPGHCLILSLTLAHTHPVTLAVVLGLTLTLVCRPRA